ncbi:MAG: SPOR domain-containing protein [Candidatus Thiodiazotropha sp.]
MKWLFSILLIANVGIFVWSYPQQRQVEGESNAAEEIGELRLVGEPQSAPVKVAANETDDTEPPQQLRDTDKPAQVDTQTDSTADMKPQQDAMPAAANKPAEEEKSPPDAVAATPPKPQCESIGVFEKRAQAETLSVQLRALGLKPDIAAETSNEQAGFWVLIPPQPTRDQAIEIAHQLEAAGVEDLWRFTSGALAHAISLGLFRDEERAIARKGQIAALGFNPVVRPRYRESTKYWLRYEYTGDSPVTAEKWQEYKQSFPDIETTTIECP